MVLSLAVAGKGGKKGGKKSKHDKVVVSLGPRPYQLVDSMVPSFLKTQLGKHQIVKHCRVNIPIVTHSLMHSFLLF